MIGGGPYIKMTDTMNKQLQHIGEGQSCAPGSGCC